MVFNQSQDGLYFFDVYKKEKDIPLMTTQEKLQENAKIAIDYAKLTEHKQQVIAHPITTEIIKITEWGSIHSFPVNKAYVQVDRDSLRNDIGTPKY